MLLGNLANIYYLKKDTAGIKYALECYELGHSMRNPYIIYSGAVNSAYMYFLMKQNEEAMKYIHEAETLMLENDFYDQAHTYNLFGNILYDMGEYAGLGILQKSHEGQTGGTNFLYCLCPFGICTYTNAAKTNNQKLFYC